MRRKIRSLLWVWCVLLLILLPVAMYPPRTLVIFVWDILHDDVLEHRGLEIHLPPDAYVLPDEKNIKPIAVGMRTESDELFGWDSWLTMRSFDQSQFLRLKAGARRTCRDACENIKEGKCLSDNGVRFEYFEFFAEGKIDIEYHALYFHEASNVLVEYHGPMSDFRKYYPMIKAAKVIESSRNAKNVDGSLGDHVSRCRWSLR